MWKKEQANLFQELREREDGGLIVYGDGRADSPGHSAKYDSYSVLEHRIGKIIDVPLIQV